MSSSTHFGIVSEPVPGHLNPALTIGRALVSRGHAVTVLGIGDLETTVAANGLGFARVGDREFPCGALDRWRSPRRSTGVAGLVESVRLHVGETEVLCRDVPAAVRQLDIDALLVDQLQVCGRFLADVTGRPFVTLCAGPGLLRTADGSFPPPFVSWPPSRARGRRLLNRAAFAGLQLAGAPRLRVTNRHARTAGVPVHSRVDDLSSPRLQISGLVPELNFDVVPPAGSPMRYFGPLTDHGRPQDLFPWDRLDGRTVVYASLGTTQSGAADVYAAIAAACAPLDVQLVMALGQERGTRPVPTLAGDPIVVDHAPQLALLDRASVCITHCGMNTTMESAAAGVPMVGIPIIYDQPAVAARIRHAGIGETIPRTKLTAERLRTLIKRVLGEPSYRSRAAAVAASCAAYGGADAAATAIEDAVATRH